MSLEPPTSILIGGRRIPIRVTSLLEDEGHLGDYDSNTRSIRLDSSTLLDPTLLRDTLTHEVIHCALDLAGISFNSSGTLSPKLEEQVVTALESLAAPAIVRVYRMTPKPRKS